MAVSHWVGRVPWRRKRQAALVLLPGESQGQRSLAGCSPWGQESDATQRLGMRECTRRSPLKADAKRKYACAVLYGLREGLKSPRSVAV